MSDSNLTVDEAAAESTAPGSAETKVSAATAELRQAAQQTVFAVIAGVSVAHLINDIMQSLLTAIYPILKENYGLDFVQLGLLTLTFQCTASLLQPIIGIYTDKRPLPYSIAAGMASPSRCSRSAAISARPSARCLPPSWSCRTASSRSSGSPSAPWSA